MIAMPAYGFKERFCPFVIDGSKPHTIRAYRTYPVKVGDTLSLYYGMRTKNCQLLRREPCTDVKTIAITEQGTVVLVNDPWLSPNDEAGLKIALATLDKLGERYVTAYDHRDFAGKPSIVLLPADKDRLAWKDGFRPAGSTLEEPTGAFALMMDFWRESHDFPFVGNIIYWEPKRERMRTITIELTDEEFMQLASMGYCAMCAVEDTGDLPPILSALGKINRQCLAAATAEERDQLREIGAATASAFNTPSIERGTLMGGFEGMRDRVLAHLKNNEP